MSSPDTQQQPTIISKMATWRLTHLFQIFWTGVTLIAINAIYFWIANSGGVLASIFASNFNWLAIVDMIAFATQSYYGVTLAANSKGLTVETQPVVAQGTTVAPLAAGVQQTFTANQVSQLLQALQQQGSKQ
jgi:hypothetical protein